MAGSFVYTPAASTVLSAGPQTLSVAFTPSDTVNYNTATKSVQVQVQYQSSGLCLGAPGHAILEPINTNGTSVFKVGSTVPAKFRVCDVNGNSVGTPGVVASFKLIGKSSDPSLVLNEDVLSTTPDTAFRWDATAQQWIYNISTKGYSPSTKYTYQIALNDGTTITFTFGTK